MHQKCALLSLVAPTCKCCPVLARPSVNLILIRFSIVDFTITIYYYHYHYYQFYYYYSQLTRRVPSYEGVPGTCT